VIRAAGGLLLRKTTTGKVRVLIVHRPAYDDWALPKGKLDAGETPQAAGLREVLEETGYRCRIVSQLGSTRHDTTDGAKEVEWFAMRPLPQSPGFVPTDEIDEIRWLSPKKARRAIDYDNERNLIAETDLDALTRTGTIRLLRHTEAGKRARWIEDDTYRPLTRKGVSQAIAISSSLAQAGIDRVLSSPFTRCSQTAAVVGDAHGVPIEIDSRLVEGADMDATMALIDSLHGDNAVVCTHGDVIPLILERMRQEGLGLPSPIHCSKGSIWEVDVDGGKYTEGRYVPPPRP
jgi:8-oxo-dGTP diphosphatase